MGTVTIRVRVGFENRSTGTELIQIDFRNIVRKWVRVEIGAKSGYEHVREYSVGSWDPDWTLDPHKTKIIY